MVFPSYDGPTDQMRESFFSTEQQLLLIPLHFPVPTLWYCRINAFTLILPTLGVPIF
jgi:hypothetical protein